MPHPVRRAIDSGCTHIVAMSPFTEGQPDWRATRARQVLARVLDGWRTGLGAEYLRSRQDWDATRRFLPVGTERSIGDSRVIRVAPSNDAHRVTRLTRDRAELLDGARVGYAHVAQLFSSENEKPRHYYFAAWKASEHDGR